MCVVLEVGYIETKFSSVIRFLYCSYWYAYTVIKTHILVSKMFCNRFLFSIIVNNCVPLTFLNIPMGLFFLNADRTV